MKKWQFFFTFIFLYFLSFNLAFAAACSSISWTDVNPGTDVTYYSVGYGIDQNNITERCQIPIPALTADCAACGITETSGLIGVQACNATYCSPLEVGALPADPTPVVPVSVQGVTVTP